MSEFTHYLLKSAGIDATEQDIVAIDASDHPEALISVLTQYQFDAATALNAMDTLVKNAVLAHKKPFELRRKTKR